MIDDGSEHHDYANRTRAYPMIHLRNRPKPWPTWAIITLFIIVLIGFPLAAYLIGECYKPGFPEAYF